MKGSRGFSFKFILAYILIMIAFIVGSFVSMHLLRGKAETFGARSDEGYKRHYAFISADTEEELWTKIYEGARIEGALTGAYVENFGADLTASYTRNELLKIAADAAVDGIVVDGEAGEEMAELVNAASARNIPVVTVFTDTSESDRISFVGLSSYALGRQYADEIMNLGLEGPARICVLMDNERVSAGQDLVVSGITDVLAEKGFSSELYSVEGVPVNNETTFTAEEDIRDIFINGDLPDVIIALDSIYTKCLFQAAVDYNRVGDVYMYGFDSSDEILEAVSKNLLEATISVDASRLGASAIEALEEYNNTGYVSTYISQDTTVIRREDAVRLLEERDTGDEED